MAEINFNNIYDQMSGTVKNSYDGAAFGKSFADQYDPDKRVANIDEVTGQPTGTFTDSNDLSLTQKDGYTQMVDAYNQEQQSETKNSFLGSLANFGSADASEMMPTNGLQTNSMGGITLNPDGSLNYNNTQPQNLGFRSMVDMANNANNFNSQFASPGRFSGMQFGPNKSNMNAPTIDRSNVMGRDLEADDGAQIVDGLTSPYTIRGQLKRDFLQGGLFRDAKNSLGETFGPIKNKIGSGLGSLKDFAMNKGTQGFNLAKQIPGMALSAMTGIPGIGMILGALGNMGSNEYAQATTANMQKQNNNLQGLGLDGVSNFGGVTTDDLGRITNNGLNYNTPEGIMSGYNSGFDLASSALGRIGKIQDGLALGKFKNVNKANQKINNLKTAAVASAQAKRQAYQDKMDRAKDSAARERARAKSITAGYGGGNDNDRPSTGPTSVGAGMGVGGGYASDYGFLKDGGSVGLASMFTRRR